MKKVLVYRDDGLGDTLFTIPTLKLLSLSYEVLFVTNHVKLAKEVLGKNIQISNVRDYKFGQFDYAFFLGPWGKIKSIDHLRKIILTKSKNKFLSSYRDKLSLKILEILLKIFKDYNFIDFGEIFEGHDIINTYNFVNRVLKLGYDRNEVLGLYNYEFYLLEREELKSREIVVLHFTYKSLDFGVKLEDYYKLARRLSEFGKLLIVFGPYEEKFVDLFSSQFRKVIITDIVEYMNLCREVFLLVGFDTGPVHLASFFNVPFVVSFFPDSGFDYRVKRWAPFSNRSKVFVYNYSSLNWLEKLEFCV